MSRKPNGYWNYDTCYEEAKKYTSRNEFMKGSGSAYQISWKNDWLDDFYWFKENIKKPRGYWTKEHCYEEAKKYHSRLEFVKENEAAYKVALANGWIDDYTWFENYSKSFRYWYNYEHCYEEAKKYDSRNKFKKGSCGAYKIALKKKWIDDYTWFKKRNHWDYENCYNEAKKYNSRVELQKGNPSVYNTVRKNGWIDDYTWFERKNNPFKNNMHNVYAYFFEDFHAVYIGLTKQLDIRDSQHHTTDNSQVHKFAKTHGIPIPQMTILEENISIDDSLIKEDFYVKKYKEEGWNVLNKAKTGIGSGALGSYSRKWTKNLCEEEAKKYKTKTEFQKKCQSAYSKALKNGWLNEYNWFEEKKKQKNYWSKEHCEEEAKKYKTRIELEKGNGSAYKVALKNGWLNDYGWMKPIIKPRGYWTKEHCYEEAKKYKTRTEFAKGSMSAYKVVRLFGWMDEFFPIDTNKAV